MSDRKPPAKTGGPACGARVTRRADAATGGRTQAVTSHAAGQPHPLYAPVKTPLARGVRVEKLWSCSTKHGAPKGVWNYSIVFPHATANRGVRRAGSHLVRWQVVVRLDRRMRPSSFSPEAEATVVPRNHRGPASVLLQPNGSACPRIIGQDSARHPMGDVYMQNRYNRPRLPGFRHGRPVAWLCDNRGVTAGAVFIDLSPSEVRIALMEPVFSSIRVRAKGL